MKKGFTGQGAAVLAGLALGCGSASADETPADSIIVTAQKRPENVRDVPLSIGVLTGEALRREGASSLTDYSAAIAGLAIISGGSPGQATITLRGVAGLTNTQTVGIYLDDAPVGSSGVWARSGLFSLDLMPYDIERIEVLRGPQGTLYGASSVGGLLKYVTVAPDLSAAGLQAGTEVFAIDGAGKAGWAVQARANAPLVRDRLAIVASFAVRKAPGYIDGATAALRNQNGVEQRGGRVGLLWRPDDRLSVKLGGLWQTIESDGNSSVVADLVTGQRIGNGRTNNNLIAEPFRKDIDFYSATVDYDLGFATATSATSYSRTQTGKTLDGTVALLPLTGPGLIVPFVQTLDLKKWTQEVRLASPAGGPFEWMAGGFYTHENSRTNQDFTAILQANGMPLGPLLAIAQPSTYKELAFFANATWRPIERFDLSGGIRWARNRQAFNPSVDGQLVNVTALPGRTREAVVTYSVSPQYHLSDDATVYGRVASGYRPGGPNVVHPLIPPVLGSDRLTNYEIGFKGDLLDRRLRVDIAAFIMDWRHVQVTEQIGTSTFATNAGTASSKGVEGAVTVRPATGLSLSAAASYADAKLTGDAPASVGGKDGDRLPNAPRFTASLEADYTTGIGRGATASFGLGLRHIGSRWSLLQSHPAAVKAGAYTTLEAHASLSVQPGWTMRAYVRNLANSHGESSRQVVIDEAGAPAYISLVPIEPRRVGLAVDVAF